MEQYTKAQSMARRMGAGWNLGNTLDACDLRRGPYVPDAQSRSLENAWFNPTTTRAMIDLVAAAGFRTLRVPVTWYQHIDDANGWQVNPSWMARVREVVEMGLDAGLIVVLNVHHDTGVSGWLRASAEGYARAAEKFRALWQQIAERFRDVDDRLIFEGLNEILDDEGHWQCPGVNCTEVVNRYQQDFVDTVRQTGGNNADRVLMINAYAGAHEPEAMEGFRMPRDTATGCLMAQVHYYSPIDFCFPEERGKYTAVTWRELGGEAMLQDMIARMEDKFLAHGVPVVVGEFAAAHKDNEPEQASWARYLASQLSAHAMPYIWWDNGGRDREPYRGMGLLDRRALRWRFPAVVEALTGTRPSC